MSLELTPTNLLTAVVLGGLAAAPRPADLSFAPEEGSDFSVRFEQHWVLDLADQQMTMVVDGEELERDAPELEITIETRDEYTFEVEILEVVDGRATRLQRTLEEVVAVSSEEARGEDGETFEETREGQTELEGAPIVFAWDEDEEIYVASFGEDADVDDEDLLEGLEGEDVLVAFLGPEDAEEGDSWDVDLDAFRRLSNPGGDLKIVKEGDAEDQPEFEEAFYENLEGEIRAEHLGTRDQDGTELVVIGIVIEVETEVGRAEDLEGDEMDGTIEETFAFSFEVEGELLWDPDAGHASSLALEGSIELGLAREQNIEGGGQEIRIQVDQEFEGTVEYTASVE